MDTGTVTIGSKSWDVNIATTFSEIAQGLSGTDSLTSGTAMLFQLSGPVAELSIDMSSMNYPLDIIYLGPPTVSGNDLVASILKISTNVQPFATDEEFIAVDVNASYFMEMNASDANGLTVGDVATITDNTPTPTPAPAFDISSLISGIVIPLMTIGIMAKMMKSIN